FSLGLPLMVSPCGLNAIRTVPAFKKGWDSNRIRSYSSDSNPDPFSLHFFGLDALDHQSPGASSCTSEDAGCVSYMLTIAIFSCVDTRRSRTELCNALGAGSTGETLASAEARCSALNGERAVALPVAGTTAVRVREAAVKGSVALAADLGVWSCPGSPYAHGGEQGTGEASPNPTQRPALRPAPSPIHRSRLPWMAPPVKKRKQTWYPLRWPVTAGACRRTSVFQAAVPLPGHLVGLFESPLPLMPWPSPFLDAASPPGDCSRPPPGTSEPEWAPRRLPHPKR